MRGGHEVDTEKSRDAGNYRPLLTVVDPARVTAKTLLDWIEGSVKERLKPRQYRRLMAVELLEETWKRGQRQGPKRRHYREVEFAEQLGRLWYLMVEDIQDVGEDDDNQDEFYLPLSQIVINNGCNIIFTSDRPVTHLALVNPDHREFIEWGKIVHLGGAKQV